MTTKHQAPPHWIIARLGNDMNWWLDEASEEIYWPEGARSILDPRQVAHLADSLDAYSSYGYRRQQFAAAFQAFLVESELSDGRLRLAPTDENILDGASQFFALPVIETDGAGAYYDFLDNISAARIRRLNATHHYAKACTEFEMFEELDALDRDRYFSAASIHAFEEINEILEWSPAEWDEPEQ